MIAFDLPVSAPGINEVPAKPAQIRTFSRAFAPSEGYVATPEKPYRAELCLNGSWQFQPVPVPGDFKEGSGNAPNLPSPSPEAWDPHPIKIPSPWNVNGFNTGDGGDFRNYPSYPSAWNNVQMGWLRRSFTVPKTWKNKRLRLRFDAIAGNAEIYINGHKVGENFDLFLPAEYDVTQWVRFDGPNELRIGVRKASLFNKKGQVGARTYPGGSMWGQAIVGIWQDVFLEALPPVHVADQYITAQVAKGILTSTVTLQNHEAKTVTVQVGGQVSPWENLSGNSVLSAPEPRWRLGKPVLAIKPQTVTIPAGKAVTVTLRQNAGKALHTWSPDTPNLYGCVISVSQGAQMLDRKYTRFGWREFTFKGNRQLLNGKPLELRGDSWHFMGVPQMTRRYAWSWYKALKETNGNAVRLHAQPYPAFYLDVADEMGICVLDETAIWGSDAGHAYDAPEFWTRSDDHVRRLILRDRNHASVFGWSVSNEVAWYVNQKHPDLKKRLVEGWQSWLTSAHQLDPSRPWVSTDGDDDADGIMPTSISHYAPAKNIVRHDKPFGQGETGGAYYATPKYAAQFAGPRAYESQEGRMEGIAREAYSLIREQRSVGASYASVFNLAWYGLQPLPFGLTDTSRPATLKDGIFFGPYKEGMPGTQPERLGPYSSTLNPGYDPRLPLYEKWSLADAIKAAYTPGGPVASPWDHTVASPKPVPATPAAGIDSVVVLAEKSSSLPNELQALGATVADVSALDTARFIVVDAAAPPETAGNLWERVAARVRQGATCLVINVTESSPKEIQNLLPKPVQVTGRTASSLVIQSSDPLLGGMDNSDFYFAESDTRPVIQHGLQGPLVSEGRVILAAPATDWRRWNNQPEALKTGAVVRSERESKPGGAALVEVKQGQGRYLVSTIDLSNATMNVVQTVTRMMTNAGVRFEARTVDTTAALDTVGHLRRALVLGRVGDVSTQALYDTDYIGVNNALKPEPGSAFKDLKWTVREAGEDSAFNFRDTKMSGPQDNAAVYLSFWVWSPRPLDNLLIEPNMPRLDLLMGSDDGCQVWLNAKLIKEDRGVHPLTPDSIVAEALPLQRGWNHLVVKVVQGDGNFEYTARLRCSDAKFLLSLRSSVLPPSEK